MRMTRLWMTGCMALILLAAGRWPTRDEQDETQLRQRTRIALTSKFGVDETAQQIERFARRNGLVVLASTVAQAPAGDKAHDGEARVLVLGDASGHTPVLQEGNHAAPQLPWQVLIRQRPDGQTEVWWPTLEASVPEGVSLETLAKVTALPQMLQPVIT